MGLMVLQERGCWLGLTNLTTKEEELFDTPIVPQGLFGTAVTSMQKRCEEKRVDEAETVYAEEDPAASMMPHQSHRLSHTRPLHSGCPRCPKCW